MKCPECNHNQLRGQQGMKCKSCCYRFIFDPKSHHCGSKRMTDGYFIKCIDHLSRNNSYFYTEDEIYCFMAQTVKVGLAGCLFLSVFLTGLITLVLHGTLEMSFWPALVLLPLFVFWSIRRSKKALSRKKWDKLIRRWKKYSAKYGHKSDVLAGLITTPQLTEKPNPQAEPDIYDYGANKLLICQHDIQVDWLVRNNYHSSNGTVIIAESGYPHYLTDQVKSLIENNPALEISLLHNAGPTGESMINRVQLSSVFGNLRQHEIVDTGLTHDQLKRLKIPQNIIDQYKGDFPAHALNYHHFNRLLTHSVTHCSDFDSTIIAFESSCDFGEPADFG